MRDLLGDPIPETPRMTDPLPMRVFKMNDCDWWMALTIEEAKADYVKETGVRVEELEDACELTEEELDRLIFVDTDEDERPIEGGRRSFRKELQRRIDAGVTWPEMFASTEY